MYIVHSEGKILQENKFTLNEQIANNINYYMKLRGKSRKELSKEMGVAYTTICSWCTGVKIPRAKNLVKLSKCLNCQQIDILNNPKEINNCNLDNNVDELFFKEYKMLSREQKSILHNLTKEFMKSKF